MSNLNTLNQALDSHDHDKYFDAAATIYEEHSKLLSPLHQSPTSFTAWAKLNKELHEGEKRLKAASENRQALDAKIVALMGSAMGIASGASIASEPVIKDVKSALRPMLTVENLQDTMETMTIKSFRALQDTASQWSEGYEKADELTYELHQAAFDEEAIKLERAKKILAREANLSGIDIANNGDILEAYMLQKKTVYDLDLGSVLHSFPITTRYEWLGQQVPSYLASWMLAFSGLPSVVNPALYRDEEDFIHLARTVELWAKKSDEPLNFFIATRCVRTFAEMAEKTTMDNCSRVVNRYTGLRSRLVSLSTKYRYEKSFVLSSGLKDLKAVLGRTDEYDDLSSLLLDAMNDFQLEYLEATDPDGTPMVLIWDSVSELYCRIKHGPARAPSGDVLVFDRSHMQRYKEDWTEDGFQWYLDLMNDERIILYHVTFQPDSILVGVSTNVQDWKKRNISRRLWEH